MNTHRLIRTLMFAVLILTFSAASYAQIAVGISVRIGPPALPIYAQPICPGPGYFWTPGYWAWNDDEGYYWVPGTWVIAPVGMLWTPGYWGWGGGFYAWHAGYWGPHIGFYGGINYGFGYGGVGFAGGEWRGNNFYYNRSVTNVSVTNVTNVYNKTVIVNNTTVNNVSYNGGQGGIQARPTPQEQMAEHEQHTAPIAAQTQHQQLASQNRENFARVNQGRPAIAATGKAGDFSSHSIVAARAAGGEYHAPAMSPKEARGPAVQGNRPFSAGSINNANRPMGNPSPTPQDKGFRPFTPPGGNKGSTSTGNPNAGSQGGFRPFTPPNSNNGQNKMNPAKSNPMYKQSGNSGTNPMYEPRDRSVARPPSNPQPSHSYQRAPQPHHSNPPAPRHESAPAQHNNPKPPKDEHHR